MKKFLVLFLSTILSISSVSFLYAGENDYASRMYVISEFVQSVGRNNFTEKESDLTKFSDSGKIDDQYSKDIQIAVANNVVNGYSDGTIKPDGLITRAEAAVILSKCIGSVEITQSEKQFTDVPQWAKQDVNKLTQAGIISGYSDTIFGSGDNITVKQVKILTDKIEDIVNKNDPKDDFYKYVNNKFERNYSLDGKQSYDYFNIVQELIDDRVKKIILSSSAKSNENQTRINDLYNLYMDTDSRNNLGIEPIKPYLDKVDSIKSVSEIPELESYLYKELYLSPLFNIYVDSNPDNSSKNTLYINNSNVILSKSYYYDLETEATKTAYNSYIKSIFAKAGVSLRDEDASAIYNFEKKICQQVDTDDYSAYGIRSNSASIDQYAKNISVKSFIENVTDKKNVDTYIINANSLKLMTTNLTDANINAIKNYYKAVIITYFSPYLSEDISNSYQKMCSAIFGSEASTTDELAVSFVENYANTAVSREYAGLYYNEQKNQAVITMVNDVLESYKEMLSSNEWLSDETKKEAVNKLSKIAIKVGYNKTVPSYYNRLSVTSKENGGTLVQNIINMNKVLSSQSMSNVNGAVDKNEWALSPLTVNACYVPLRNEICIPMAVLESPLYSEDADYQTNLASVGSIIAHEVSHAFDPSGARYDADGNYRNWWTEKDENKFYDYVDDFTRYFGKYEVAGGVDNNGFNTILENVADVSGVTCITNIAEKNGYDMASFMKSYAKLWSGLMTDEYAKKVSKIDTHSVGKIRVNGVLSDIDQFYSIFDVQSGDGMYIAPENRVKIW